MITSKLFNRTVGRLAVLYDALNTVFALILPHKILYTYVYAYTHSVYKAIATH